MTRTHHPLEHDEFILFKTNDTQNWIRPHGGQVNSSGKGRHEVERLYRNTFEFSPPNVKGVPEEVLHDFKLKALLRGTPVTEEELLEWVRLQAGDLAY